MDLMLRAAMMISLSASTGSDFSGAFADSRTHVRQRFTWKRIQNKRENLARDLDCSDVCSVEWVAIHDGDLGHVPQQPPLPLQESHVSNDDDVAQVGIRDV